jgi:DnaK suppressor protein
MTLKSTPQLKEQLIEIRKNLLGDLQKTRETSQNEEFTEFVSDITDDATRSANRQMILNLGEHEREQLKLVEEALYKIENGGYGICILCENSIPPARLQLVPYAQYCVECLSQIEKEKKLEIQTRDNGSII